MVIWTDNAISDITDFIDNARIDTERTAKEYMNKLVDYVDILEDMPEIGKQINFNMLGYELRQLVYKKHKVIYHIKEKNEVILAVLHGKLDMDVALRRLKRKIE